MVAFGLFVAVLSGLLGVGVLLSNTDPAMASAFGVSLANVTVGEFFLLGAGVGVVFTLGLAAAVGGARRRRVNRLGRKDQVASERSEREQLEEQNALLREQVQRGGMGTDVVDPAGTGDTDVAATRGRGGHREPQSEDRADDGFPR